MKQILFLFILLLTGLTNALAQNGKERVIQDISYINPNDSSSYRKERCKLDLYLPKSQKTFKTLVWFHGGGLTGGEKEIPNELKGKEFAIVAPNYRLYPRCKIRSTQKMPQLPLHGLLSISQNTEVRQAKSMLVGIPLVAT